MGEIKQVDLSNVVNNKITYGKNDIVDEFSGLDGNYIDREILARIWESAVGKFFILKIFPFPLAIRAALSKNYARANPKDRMTTYTANQKDRR